MQHLYVCVFSNGWTQAQIAQSIGRSQGWVSAVLRGEFGDIKWADGIKLRDLREAPRAPKVTEPA